MFPSGHEAHILEQRARQKADAAIWPRQDEGVYRGYKWMMRRPNGAYWCGYVDLSPAEEFLNEGETHFEQLESRAHCGITGGYQTMSGFDCSHYGDFYFHLVNRPETPDLIYHASDLVEMSTNLRPPFIAWEEVHMYEIPLKSMT